MFLRTSVSSEIHDKMIKALCNEFQKKGFFIRADHIGHPNGTPPSFGGHIPDIYAEKQGNRIIAEAETGDSIDTQETYQQFRTFSNVAGTEFHVIVPENCSIKAQHQAAHWGIRVDQWWSYKS